MGVNNVTDHFFDPDLLQPGWSLLAKEMEREAHHAFRLRHHARGYLLRLNSNQLVAICILLLLCFSYWDWIGLLDTYCLLLGVVSRQEGTHDWAYCRGIWTWSILFWLYHNCNCKS